MMKKEEFHNIWLSTIQFAKFGMVGISNTAISYIVFAFLVKMGIHYLFANAIGFLISVLNSFFWNSKYVFKNGTGEKRYIIAAFVKSVFSYSLNSLFLVSVLLYVWIVILHISPYIAQVLNLLITIPLNFLMNKYWAFK